ncbi:hypothetical protein EQM14_01660 [Caproiciproducens sp. NJN-50]|uniref:hypothetical protein n=1 Tax=Caproiciproducens sp. NJN-50 TaxID=2507162 RepID=UPI000FFE0159|nr:hypothetical protein [Caproiciproducens sp. NJN-50]QAT48590.1 hypothetical protein EQM14_01660 [Caproiciproducens sp. NJN-50]
MDKTLESFLHPHRKPNLKVRLKGFDEEFEFRQLSANEGIEVAKDSASKDLPGSLPLVPTMAAAMVKPNLRSKELQDALSEKCGHKIMEPYDALIELITDSELAELMKAYSDFVNANADFMDGVKEAKNA